MFLHKPSLIVSFSRCVADPQRDDCQQLRQEVIGNV